MLTSTEGHTTTTKEHAVNSLNLTGRLTRDPELRDLPDGRFVCDIRIASDTIGEQPPLYLDLATFDKQAEACHRYLTMGREIAFSGRLIHREWTTDDGTKHSKHSAVGRVEFLSGGARSDSDEEAGAAIAARHNDPDEIVF